MEKETSPSTQDYILAEGKPEAISDGIDGTKEVEGQAMMPQQKQGHQCCGVCCDMRRATMIVNYINIAFLFVGLWYITTVAASANAKGGQYVVVDDDVMEEAYAEVDELKGVGIVVTVMVIRLICNATGIYGAHIYNFYLVGVSLAAYALEFILALLSFNVAGLLLTVFFAYPHVLFIREVRVGIMTPENYPMEEQSCCCV